MSADLSTRDELVQGMTVEIDQENGDRIVGEVGTVPSDQRTHSEGIGKVQSRYTGTGETYRSGCLI